MCTSQSLCPALPAFLALLLAVHVGVAATLPDAPTPNTAPNSEPAGSSDPAVPDDATLEKNRAVIGKIEIYVGKIFDPEVPGESGKLYRFANRLHIKTRDPVVRRQLLFKTGDPYSRRLLEESERLLRANRYLYDATIRPVGYRDNRVDIEVAVRDVWTFAPGIGFRRSGGVNSARFELQDTNFLGTGKDITLQWASGVDRDTLLLRYRDPNLVGSRVRLEAWYSENSDGDLRRLDVVRPFYSMDARWAAGLKTRSEDRIDSLYTRGEITDQFRHGQSFVELFGGLSKGLVGGKARRWTVGAAYLEDRFEPAPDLEAPTILPEDRTLVYPWVGYEWVQDDYLKDHDLDKLTRTEDLALGVRLLARLGVSWTGLGADRDEAIFGCAFHDGFFLGRERKLITTAHVSGRWGSQGSENFLTGAAARVYWRNWGRHLLFARISADLAHDLDAENQLLLGGDNGLRGYPLRFQQGDRRFLLTLEQRFFSGWEILHLAYVGGAVFFDIGRAWFAGAPSDANGELLKDVGLGLRLGSSRSGRGGMVHLDVAFPLDGDDSIESVQWLVTTKETF
jgi:hypothetical protein